MKTIFFTLSFLAAVLAFAQTPIASSNTTQNGKIKIALIGSLNNNLGINTFGKKTISVHAMPSGELNLSYQKDIKNNFAFNVGLGFGFAPFGYKNKVSPDDLYTSSFVSVDYKQKYFALPVSIEKKIDTKHKFSHIFELGLKLNYMRTSAYKSTIYSMQSPEDTPTKIFELWLGSPKNKFFVSGFAKYGMQFELKEQNNLQCFFVLHYSPTRIRVGQFETFNAPFISYGFDKSKLELYWF